MRNDQLRQALLRAGFKAEKEIKRDSVSRYTSDDKPSWESLSQFERDYYQERFARWQANSSLTR